MADTTGVVSDSLEGLAAPCEIRGAISRLADDLARAAGANLAELMLYGGLARGRYRTGKSDINVVVLLWDTSTESLAAIAPILRAAWRAVRKHRHAVAARCLEPPPRQLRKSDRKTRLFVWRGSPQAVASIHYRDSPAVVRRTMD